MIYNEKRKMHQEIYYKAMCCTFAIEVKISATKKSGNDIGCMQKRTGCETK